MRRWEVVVVAACVLLVLWAWWPRPRSVEKLEPPAAVARHLT